MRMMKSPGEGERREQGGTQQEHQPLPPCISSSRLTVPPLRPGNWPGGPPPACRFAEDEVVEGGSLVYSEGVAMICEGMCNSRQHVGLVVNLETSWRDCPENKRMRGLTLSTTFPKMPSSPLTSSPPFFAEHSMNIQGGSREAANAWPSAVETVRENSCKWQSVRERKGLDMYICRFRPEGVKSGRGAEAVRTHLVDLVPDNHPHDLPTCRPRPRKRVELVDPRRQRLERIASGDVVDCGKRGREDTQISARRHKQRERQQDLALSALFAKTNVPKMTPCAPR